MELSKQDKEKQCSKCKEIKDLDYFKFRKDRNHYESRCKKCSSVNHKKWSENTIDIRRHKRHKYYLDNKDKIIEKSYEYRNKNRKRYNELTNARILKRKYGITKEQKEDMIKNQGGLCLICKLPEPDSVDHCHETGKVRGVLHKTCNSALGLLKDNFDIILNAAKYIQKHKNVI